MPDRGRTSEQCCEKAAIVSRQSGNQYCRMPNLREETLNTYLALLLEDYDGISAAAEIRGSADAIDITVTQEGTTPSVKIFLEAKIGNTGAKRRQAEAQARSRLSGRPRALAFAVCYPQQLRDGSVSSKATQLAMAKAQIAFAPVPRFGPSSTWRVGTIDDLASSLRHADVPRRRVAETIEHTVREAAEILSKQGCAHSIAEALVLPKTDEELKAAPLIAALMLSNAALLHQRLRLVEPLSAITKLKDATSVHPEALPANVRAAWSKILEVDYHPVFSPALAVVNALSDDDLAQPLNWIAENAIAVADELASLRFDHAGPLYHRLLSSARYDGSFYTNNVSALLLARLALTESAVDWSDVEALARLKVIDPACGTGTLLMAAMHAIRDRYENAVGPEAELDLLHLALVEDVIYGLDINRHGVQLAACNLTLGNPRVDYRRMNLYTMQHGPQADGSYKAGSLELLATAKDERDIISLAAPLPTAEDLHAERAEPGAVPSESLTQQFDLVIMNPPFTRNDIRNRQYDRVDRRPLQEREIEIANFLAEPDGQASQAIDQTSVRTFFSPLADALLKKNGLATLAKVVPTTALTGPSGINERRFLAERFQVETVVTSHDPKHISFSENTSIHESLVVARRRRDNRKSTRFISLARMPSDPHEAILLSDLINSGENLNDWGTEFEWPEYRVRKGDWTAAQFYDGVLAEAIDILESLAGLYLVTASDRCHIEPAGQRVRDAFLPPNRLGTEYRLGHNSLRQPAEIPESVDWAFPLLWEHPTDVQTTMQAKADVLGIHRKGMRRYAEKTLAPKANRLLIANRIYTHQVRISACYASEPLLGSAWTPVKIWDSKPELEKALCAWWNSTPGVLTLLHARSRKLTYPRYALASLRSLLIPDLSDKAIQALADAFDKTRSMSLLPWPRMSECSTRPILDMAAARVLRMDGRMIVDWRARIAREPTVSGHPLY